MTNDTTSTDHLGDDELAAALAAAPMDAQRRHHLEDCRSCRAELEELGKAIAVVRAQRQGDEPDWQAMESRLLAHGPLRSSNRWRGLALFAAAAALIAVTLLPIVNRSNPSSSELAEADAIAVLEAVDAALANDSLDDFAALLEASSPELESWLDTLES